MLRRGGGTGAASGGTGTNPSRRIPGMGRSNRAPRRTASPAQNVKQAPHEGMEHGMNRQLHHDALSYATALEMQMAQKAAIAPPVQQHAYQHQPYVEPRQAPGMMMMADHAAGGVMSACVPAKPYMPIDTAYPGLRCIHAAPPIYMIDHFLTDTECDMLMDAAGPLLQRSKTHAAAGDDLTAARHHRSRPSGPRAHPAHVIRAGSEATKGRTSLTCHLSKQTPPCGELLAKIRRLTGKPYDHMELPQVARYTDSQRYVEHYDGVDPHTDAGRAFCASGGQRVCTVLAYLNDVARPRSRTHWRMQGEGGGRQSSGTVPGALSTHRGMGGHACRGASSRRRAAAAATPD